MQRSKPPAEQTIVFSWKPNSKVLLPITSRYFEKLCSLSGGAPIATRENEDVLTEEDFRKLNDTVDDAILTEVEK